MNRRGRRDGRGPLGMGPMTGRGFGPCGGGYYSRRFRFGNKAGHGPGFGRRNRYSDLDLCELYPMDAETERDFMEREKNFLKERLESIKNMLSELEK